MLHSHTTPQHAPSLLFISGSRWKSVTKCNLQISQILMEFERATKLFFKPYSKYVRGSGFIKRWPSVCLQPHMTFLVKLTRGLGCKKKKKNQESNRGGKYCLVPPSAHSEILFFLLDKWKLKAERLCRTICNVYGTGSAYFLHRKCRVLQSKSFQNI